ncbi:MAG: M14 family metallopeptidase [Planctomycetota bacterium]
MAELSEEEAQKAWPLTVAESSDYTRSSTLAEVEAFLEELKTLPAASSLSFTTFGETTEGRRLHAVTVSAPRDEATPARLRVLVNANIHGGEIEGKVAVQAILREMAHGYHEELLKRVEVTFVPVFNADGNDRIARTNRVTQNGPEMGVGERANAMGLDLNRDFVKLETPEVRSLTTLVRHLDPHAFMDLHTTNGSPHGYDLTYASSLSPNAPAELASYMAESFFPAVRETLGGERGFPIHVYDYGNFEYRRREPGSRGERGDPIRWSTYDSRPRFGTNLMGLRGKVSILSEAYSYLPYERRIAATYLFVVECLRKLAADADRVRKITSSQAAAPGSTLTLGVDATLDSVGTVPVRVGRWNEVVIDLDPETEGVQQGRRRVSAGPDAVREVEMEVRSRFRAERQAPYTEFFAVLDPSEEVTQALEVHLGPATKGGALERVADARVEVAASVFVVEEAKRSQRPFQGHREVSVDGQWEERNITLPQGTLLVKSSILTAHLLHPESDDSLTTWNFFDAHLFRDADREEGEGAAEDREDASKGGAALTHPVVLIR